jgi:hypothetical protein
MMLNRTEYNQLAMKNRDRVAQMEQHIDDAEMLYGAIADNDSHPQDKYSRLQPEDFSTESFVGVHGDDLAVLETALIRLLDKIQQWGALEWKLRENATFCLQEASFIEDLHGACDPVNQRKNVGLAKHSKTIDELYPNEGMCEAGRRARLESLIRKIN